MFVIHSYYTGLETSTARVLTAFVVDPTHAPAHAPIPVYSTSGYSAPPAGPTAYGSAPVSSPYSSSSYSSFPVEPSTYSSVTPSLPAESYTEKSSTRLPATYSSESSSYVTSTRSSKPYSTPVVTVPSHSVDPAYYVVSASKVHPAAAAAEPSSAWPMSEDHPVAETSSSPVFAADGSEDTECAEECSVKCQIAHVAADIIQCRTSCISACAKNKKVSAAHGSPTSGRILANNGIAAAAAAPDSCSGDHGFPGVNSKAAVSPSHGGPVPVVATEMVTFESCMRSCKGKWQSAFAGISQGETDCEEACAHYAEAGTGITVKRSKLPLDGPFQSSNKPTLKLSDGAVSFEACMKSCKSKFQKAFGHISTGSTDCETQCAQYSEEGPDIVLKRDLARDGPFQSTSKPSLKLGAGGVSYEACMRSCQGKTQKAFHISTGEHHCKTECARYAEEGTNLIVKKDKLPHSDPFQSSKKPTAMVGDGAMTFEACMKSCGGKFQDVFGLISTSEHHCKTECAQYAEKGPKVVIKRDLPATSPFQTASSGVEVGAGFVDYAACMQKCTSDLQTAFHISQGDKDCETTCAKYAEEGTEAIVKRERLFPDGPFQSSNKPTVKVGDGAITYESCMQSCGGKWQKAFGKISTGKDHCETSCAQYAQEGADIVIKRDARTPTPVYGDGPSTVVVGSENVAYEACMHGCSGKQQSASKSISQGEYDCKTQCARYISIDSPFMARSEAA
ncbi:hypothetical protein GGR51DRAFT_180815 [Nemania sp. FL0031]|nr:hypothetical protein GGR51DRAFT_180815 [Nemania sp. FL0031]